MGKMITRPFLNWELPMAKFDYDPNNPSPIRQMLTKQLELALGFAQIERDNGLYYPPIEMLGNSGIFATEVQTLQFQEWCRSTMWRIVEELSEARQESYQSHEYYVEVCDALHFLLELSVMTGVPPALIEDTWPTKFIALNGVNHIHGIINSLGMAGHSLKTRPWKRNQKPTDWKTFQQWVAAAWYSMCGFWSFQDYTPEQLLALYMEKHQENVGRQQSGI